MRTAQPLVEIWRGPFLESRHLGHVCVCDEKQEGFRERQCGFHTQASLLTAASTQHRQKDNLEVEMKDSYMKLQGMGN